MPISIITGAESAVTLTFNKLDRTVGVVELTKCSKLHIGKDGMRYGTIQSALYGE